ncbi:unnamed protein product [Phytophthora lilii]|uniref:Unnamed protein product n=1 Tax=Phytophthora lilii TaxID=2077276 RepID=A0A9W6YIJ1_9STRA|nr:unnamed protein product [Phytophthora lilii]
MKSYARFDPSDEAAGTLDWAIVTSSNLSKAAWGTFQKNKTQFMIRSYELGVMFLPQLVKSECPAAQLVTIGSKAAELSGVEASASHPAKLLPLPYQFPMTTYNPKKDEPWVWDLVRENPDIFGNAVVLPTDELVRVECAATMTVADLVRKLEKRCPFQKSSEIERRDQLNCHDNNCDTDPATEASYAWRSKHALSKLSQGTLTLVRLALELKAGALVIDEVEELDILDFHLVHSQALKWIPETNGQQSRRVSPIFRFPPHNVGEEVRPLSTTIIPLWRVKQNQTAKGEQTAPLESSAVINTCSELIERMQSIRKDVRTLVFLIRDAILGGSTLNADALLSLSRTMVQALTHPSVSLTSGSAASEDTRENLARKLSWDIAGKDGGITIILEGWVVTAEWGTFWRTQRKEYACLCDNHMLYFFSSRTHCSDFIFELGREPDGNKSDLSKRILKDNNPTSQIDLSETDWSVRKSSLQDDGSEQPHRNAFAFFDSKGKMKLVMDVSTSAEASTWVRLISAEINRNHLFLRMRELNSMSAITDAEKPIDALNPLTTWLEIMTQSSATTGNQHSLVIPLRSLYSQIDRMNGTARAERYKSWTLNQALKDLQRDRVKINDQLLASASLEANILALTLAILKCTEPEYKNASAKARPVEGITAVSEAAKEMTALRFARQVIICSSRTHGGGDILDTLHLLFGNERFCICPDARSMEPIEIAIFRSENVEATLVAQISMKMIYRVIPSDSIGPIDDHSYAIGGGEAEASAAKSVSGHAATARADQQEPREFKILGTYTQILNCHFKEANGIEGSVQLQFAA